LKPYISVVSPVYRAEESLELLVKKIKETLLSIGENFEIVLVEDGSPDRSWEKIVKCCMEDIRVKGIKLSRNFGQHYAITAGLDVSRGDKVVVMDCDLQDDPKYIIDLLKKSKEGFAIVHTVKLARKHPFFKNIYSKLFHWFFNLMLENSKNKTDENIGNFCLLDRKVVDALIKIHDYHRHFLMILRWVGFSTATIQIAHVPRPYGKSSYTFGKLVAHALNGITSQSNKLLYFSIGVGFTFFLLSITGIFILLFMYFTHGYKEGWTSMIAMILLSTGLILMSLGILGIYIGKIFDQTKDRPLFLIDQKINL
jgi:glycosyltransferase involved in cell wall biosynthesis